MIKSEPFNAAGFYTSCRINGSLQDSLGPGDTIAYSSVSTPLTAAFGEMDNDVEIFHCNGVTGLPTKFSFAGICISMYSMSY